MNLNELQDRPGSRHSRIRRGRGIGSGKGKTSGRGHKGQKSRAGASIKGFEGGQMPLYRRVPKRGFFNSFRKHLSEVNIGRIQKAIDAGLLDSTNTVDGEALLAAGVVRRVRDGIRILGNGTLSTKLVVEAESASKSAAQAIEAVGGELRLTRPAKDESKDPGKKNEKKRAKKAAAPEEDAEQAEGADAPAGDGDDAQSDVADAGDDSSDKEPSGG